MWSTMIIKKILNFIYSIFSLVFHLKKLNMGYTTRYIWHDIFIKYYITLRNLKLMNKLII